MVSSRNLRPRPIYVLLRDLTNSMSNLITIGQKLRPTCSKTHTHTHLHTHIHTHIQTHNTHTKHLRTYTPTHLYTYIPTLLHTYTPAHLHTYTPIHTHTHLHTYTHARACTYALALTHLHIRTCTYTRTHACETNYLGQQNTLLKSSMIILMSSLCRQLIDRVLV